MKNKLNILVLEHSEDWKLTIEKEYTEIIKICGYECNFIFVNQPKGQIIETKPHHSIFDKFEIDLFISDLSLGNTQSPYVGLDIIRKIKLEFPELIIIANSSQEIGSTEIADNYPSFDLFVNKLSLNFSEYREHIGYLLSKLLNRNIYLNLDLENSKITNGFKISEPSQKNKLINLLKYITYNGKNREQSVTKVILKSIEDGRSNSYVFHMESYLENGLKCINSIIKISEKKFSRIEKQNYEKYVKWNLPYTWRVELMSYAEWQNYGCICYSYAFNDTTIKSVSDYIKEENTNKVLQVLETIFNPTNLTWYNKKNTSLQEGITEYYLHKWYIGSDNTRRKLPTQSIEKIIKNNNGNKNGNLISFGKYEIPSPESYLFSEKGTFLKCICHGDLSSNNILLSEHAKSPVFIDFQDTGKGHVFIDFIVFENSLRQYCNQGKSLDALIDFEIELNKLILGKPYSEINSGDIKMFDIYSNLRLSAFETFEDENRWSYIYGLAMSSYAKLRAFDKLLQWQSNQIFASLFAAIYTLKNMKISVPVLKHKENSLKVFVSYNSADKLSVQKIIKTLQENGISVWIDEENILFGDPVVKKLEVAINECNVYLICMGNNEGPWQSEEISQIISKRVNDKEKIIIPCILPDVDSPKIPGFLSNFLYLNLNKNYDTQILKLIEQLKQMNENDFK